MPEIPLNTAARLEQASEPGRISLSKDFSELLAGKIRTTSRGVVPLKNCGELEMLFFDGFSE